MAHRGGGGDNFGSSISQPITFSDSATTPTSSFNPPAAGQSFIPE